MGLDASMLIRPHRRLDDRQLGELTTAFHAAFPDEHESDRARFPTLARYGDDTWVDGAYLPDDGLIEARLLYRYFGPGVHRGGWPWIRDIGDWLACRLGETAEVRYGADSDVAWEAMTPWPDARAANNRLWATLVHTDPVYAARQAAYDQGHVAITVRYGAAS